MFPGVDGFHWTVGHILFISLFFAVALAIMATVISAVWRTTRDFRSHRAIDLCWKEDFGDLPLSDRRCRHELAGRVISRTCDNNFDCRSCENYAKFAVLPTTGLAPSLGLNYPDNRFYHRGHTWVKPEGDGSVTIGLDDLAEHLIGEPDSVKLPEIGSELEINQTAWTMTKSGNEIQVRAPLEGTVVAIGGPKHGWFLKLRPLRDTHDTATLRHLLRGPEIGGWISRETERLQLQLRPIHTEPSLADGGVLLSGLMDLVPDANWDAVLADTFLAP